MKTLRHDPKLINEWIDSKGSERLKLLKELSNSYEHEVVPTTSKSTSKPSKENFGE